MVWINKRDVNMKILLPKRYFTLRSAFRSYHYQKEPEQNQKGHRSTNIHRGASVWRWIRPIWFGGEEILRYRNREWDREGWTGDPWHLPNSTLISRRSVKWNGNNSKTEEVLYVVFMHILLVKLTTNKILLRQQAWQETLIFFFFVWQLLGSHGVLPHDTFDMSQ